MKYISVDVETDGPYPGGYSMISLGAIVVEPELTRTFYAEFRPISLQHMPEALAVSGHTREQTLHFSHPQDGMAAFADWLEDVQQTPKERLMFVSDNNGFDWQFVNYYFWRFLDHNPFGHSSTNLGSLYKGMQRSTRASFKHLRKTKHTHNPVDDARGNAEALLAMQAEGLALR